MSAHIFLIHNLITGCFLSHRNPIRRNLLLPNAQTHAPMRVFSPASQVPVVKLITLPPLAEAEAGHLSLRGHYRGSRRGGFIGASPATSTAGLRDERGEETKMKYGGSNGELKCVSKRREDDGKAWDAFFHKRLNNF